MSYITLSNIKKSFNSQKEVINKMFALFPNETFDLSCGSSNSRDYRGFRVRCPLDKFVGIATHCYINIEPLFDFGKPKVIQPGYWVYDSSYFKVSLYWRKPFIFYRTEYPIQVEDEETGKFKTIPAKESKSQEDIVLELDNNFSVGLKDWKSSYPKVLKLLDKNPNKELVKKYKEEVENANNEFERYKKSLKEIPLLKI